MTRQSCRIAIAAVILAIAFMAPQPAAATTAEDELNVVVDQATVVKLPEGVATIVVGNPLIADVSLQTGGMLVVTGKGYGATNVVALDRAGKVLMERSVRVHGPRGDVVVVYRGIQRETYSCQPNCERRITLGDNIEYFNATMNQTTVRNSLAQGSGQQPR